MMEFNINKIEERTELIKGASEAFKSEKVIATFSVSQPIVFDDITTAILWLFNQMDKKDIYICQCVLSMKKLHIVTERSTCDISAINSLQYYGRETRNDDNISISAMLDRRKEFISDEMNKLPLFQNELDHIKVSNSEEVHRKIEHMLDRYYGDKWTSYWFNFKPLSRTAVEVVLYVQLVYQQKAIEMPLKNLKSKMVKSDLGRRVYHG